MINTTTYTDIANFALDQIGGFNIQDINDTNNPNAILCKRHIGRCVKAELDKYEWTCARKFKKPVAVDLEANPDAYIKGYIAYHLPEDFSRLSQYFFSEYYPYRKNQYDLGHNYFLTADYLYTKHPLETLAYCSNKVPIAKWNQLMCDVMAAALAKSIARKIAGTDADVAFVDALYRSAVSDARRHQVLQMEPSGTGVTESQMSRVLYYG